MEVILLENIRRLGKLGETVKIKDGFGRNFLLPRGKALRANEANKKVFEERRAVIIKENGEKLKEAEKLAKKIEGLIIPIIRQASEDGRLFGSVSSVDIVKAIKDEKKLELHRNMVTLTAPIKNIGIQPVSLTLHSDLTVQVHVNVAQTDDEAANNKAAFLKGEYTGPKNRKSDDQDDVAAAAPAVEASADDEEAA
jgi:large subunit ribosomal protein L9